MWKDIVADDTLRLRVVREYAETVFGGEAYATKWLDRTNLRIRGGTCSVNEACDTPDGFYEAMAELARIERFEERETRKRTSMARRAESTDNAHQRDAASSD